MRRRPRRRGERLIDFAKGRVAVLKGVERFIGIFFLLPVVNRGIVNPDKEGELPGAERPCPIQVLFEVSDCRKSRASLSR
jgi:hypothetical protein